jgi:hypothetical protein
MIDFIHNIPIHVLVLIYVFSGFANGFEPDLVSVIDTPDNWSLSDSDVS